jgi:Na+-transporting NADH:ubiquinone oxidoreductase subunit NqrF
MKKFFIMFSIIALGIFVNCGGDEKSSSKADTVPEQALEVNYAIDEAISTILSTVPDFPAEFDSTSYSSVQKRISTSINKSVQNATYYDTGVKATANFEVKWSYNDDVSANPQVYTYTFTFLKDYTVTLTSGESFTFKSGGYETYTLNMYNNNTGTYTTSANYPYTYNGNHTIGWTFNGSESDTAYSISGSITFDGTSYPFEESGTYSTF